MSETGIPAASQEKTLKQIFLDWFKPIRYSDDDELDRRSVLLNLMIFMNAVLAACLAATHIMFFHHATGRFWVGIELLIFVLLLLIPLRRGYVNPTCKMFVIGMAVGVTIGVANAGTLRAPLALTYVVVVVCAGLLQNIRFVIFIIGFCSLSILGLILAEQGGMLPPPVAKISVDQWVITTEVLIWIGWITQYTVRNLIRARAHVRTELIDKEKAEIALKQNEELLSRVFKFSPNAMAVSSMENNRLLRVNDTFVQLMGFSSEEVIGQKTNKLGIWADIKDLIHILAEINQHSEIVNKEVNFRKKDGTIIKGLLSAAPVEFADERWYVWGFFDLTERNQAEKVRLDLELQLFEAQKEELRDEFNRKELNQARDIQHSLLPGVSFQHLPYVISSRSVSAAEVGGDYYDYFALPSGKLVVVIGDVSGHGLSSGLLMAMVKSSLYSIVPDSPDINKVLQTLNGIVRLGGASQRMFLTFCYAIIDPIAGILSCSINGHPFPLVRKSDGTVIELGESAYPLGIRSQPEVKIKQQPLGAGDKVLLYTDGIPEITDADGQVWGYPPIRSLFAENGNLQGSELIDQLFAQAYEFASGIPQDDDMTALCIEVKEAIPVQEFNKGEDSLSVNMKNDNESQLKVVELSIPIEQDMELTATRVAEALAQMLNFEEARRSEISMALLEACINSFEHSHSADRTVNIKFYYNTEQLRIVLSDKGVGFDVSAISKPLLKEKLLPGARKRGWGLQLMETLMDEVKIESGSKGTTITMVKKR
jgi:PAS domain S-box-containing protein